MALLMYWKIIIKKQSYLILKTKAKVFLAAGLQSAAALGTAFQGCRVVRPISNCFEY